MFLSLVIQNNWFSDRDIQDNFLKQFQCKKQKMTDKIFLSVINI